MMQILRADWTGRGKWKKVAQAFNSIATLINDMVGENGIEVGYRGGRLVISADGVAGGGGAVDYSRWAFGHKLVSVPGETGEDPSTTACQIQPGTIRFHGGGYWKLAEATSVALDPMSAPWVYAQMPRGGGAISILASSTEPISNSTTLKIPLVQFQRTTGGTYVLPPGGIHHAGDGVSGGGSSFPGLNVSFGFQPDFPHVTVAAGELHIHAAAHAVFSQATVELLAETCTIYAQCRKGTLADRQILVSASAPETDDTFYRFKLYTFTYNAETSTYVRIPKIHRIGDIDFDTPVL
jgi:hypothetical protein